MGTSVEPLTFQQRVRRNFGRQAMHYEGQARLQRAVAWRLGRLCRNLPLPAGATADLGSGSGLLSRALLEHWPALRRQAPLQLDVCPELLERNPLLQHQPGAFWPCPGLQWDLDEGLPPVLQDAALLASSFALQWLEAPERELARWCRWLKPGGWLVLAVPTAGSFPQWHRAAAAAAVPCTALSLPKAQGLISTAAGQGLHLHRAQRLTFTVPCQGGLITLRRLQRLGAGSAHHPPLAAGQLRRLLRHWPAETPLSWEVLLLLARKGTQP